MEICQIFYVLSSKTQKDWRDKKINTYSDVLGWSGHKCWIKLTSILEFYYHQFNFILFYFIYFIYFPPLSFSSHIFLYTLKVHLHKSWNSNNKNCWKRLPVILHPLILMLIKLWDKIANSSQRFLNTV